LFILSPTKTLNIEDGLCPSMINDGAFSVLPIFSTDRLELRRLVMEDADLMFEVKADPEVTFLYGERPHKSVEDTRKWAQDCIDAMAKHEVMIWTILLRSSGEPVGTACFWHFQPANHCAELGYELHPAFWKKGFMIEALEPILSFGFDVVGLNRIEAVPLAINEASRSLLRRLGFKEEGVLRQRVRHDGLFFDEVYYSLIAKEWRERKPTVTGPSPFPSNDSS
jgi:ribosomal-protein-alanine N-acetyltransferase